jgi:polyisoprenoid-binding protein YceI
MPSFFGSIFSPVRAAGPSRARLYGMMKAAAIGLTVFLAIAAVGCGASATPVPAPATAPAPVESAAPVAPTAAPPVAQPIEGPTAEPIRPPEPAAAPASETVAPEPTLPSVAAELAVQEMPAPGQVGNVVFVIGEGSEATFTVNEKLARLELPNDAVMRTGDLSGNVYLDGQASVIEINLHSLTSDQSRRDGYVRDRMFPNNPVAIFTVPELGPLPEPIAVGESITRQVEGQLSIRGITKPVTFEVEARLDPEALFILGRTSFTWDELEIPPPNIPGRIQVKDEVSVEVLLSAVPTMAAGQ